MIEYKIDVLAALKEAGYNTSTLRKEKRLSESTIQALRDSKYISLDNLDRLCQMLHCQPGDILKFTE